MIAAIKLHYYSTTKSHDNNYCGWLYSLIFFRWLGWLGAEVARVLPTLGRANTVVQYSVLCSVLCLTLVASPIRVYNSYF
jgi:hypothetical protein